MPRSATARELRWQEAPFHDRVAGHALLGCAKALRRLPGVLAYALADLASLWIVAYTLWHERRVGPQGRGLFRNQRIVFRESWNRRLGWRLLFAWARHMAHLAVDFFRMPRIDAASLRDHLDTRPIEELRRAIGGERGIIWVTGHLGFWELGGHAGSLLGKPVTVVQRPASAAPINDVVNSIRTAGGQQVLAKRDVLWPLKKTLDRGGEIGLLLDEDTPERPVFVPFLGTVAATSPSAAFLHRSTGAPIAVVSCHRTGRERFCFRVWRVIRCAPTADRDADLRAICTAINEALSSAILSRPEQWLWGSRRFFTRPPGEVPGPDGLPPPAAARL